MASGLSKLSVAIRVVIGLVFIFAGFPKIFDPTGFSTVLRNYQLLPESIISPLSYTLPALEAAIGLFLFFGLFTRVAASLAAITSVGFGIFVVSALVRGLNIECGCFNGASRVSWLHAGLDLVILVTSIFLAYRTNTNLSLDKAVRQSAFTRRTSIKVAIITGVALLLATLNKFSDPNPSADLKNPTLTSSNPARLVFEPPILQLGTVRQETEVEGKVIYQNRGPTTIRIDRVKTSCGCTAPELTSNVLEPGESGELKVKFRAGANRGTSEQSIKLYIAGQESPTVLPVTANIDPTIVVTPGVVELKTIGDSADVRLTSNRSNLNFHVTGVSVPTSSLQLQSSMSGTRDQVDLRVTLIKPISEKEIPPIVSIIISTDTAGDCLLYVKLPLEDVGRATSE